MNELARLYAKYYGCPKEAKPSDLYTCKLDDLYRGRVASDTIAFIESYGCANMEHTAKLAGRLLVKSLEEIEDIDAMEVAKIATWVQGEKDLISIGHRIIRCYIDQRPGRDRDTEYISGEGWGKIADYLRSHLRPDGFYKPVYDIDLLLKRGLALKS